MASFDLKNNRFLQPALHIILWAAFLLYPFFLHHHQTFDTQAVVRYTLYTLMMAGVFYLNFGLLIPHLFGKRRFTSYFIIVIIIIGGVVGGNLLLQWLFNWEFYTAHPWMEEKVITNAIIMTLLILGISSGVKMAQQWFKNERMKRNIENEKLASELAYLRSQINPHFLFNSLNSIYALSQKDNKKTSEALLKLSELLRYVLYETKKEVVPLEQEIDHLRHYINFQQLRLPENVTINIHQEGATAGKKIAPLLLIPFIENAFKHGISTHHHSYINIGIKLHKETLHFSIRNSLHKEHASSPKEGIGLKNVSRRLELLYPNTHNLTIREEADHFIVKLQLQLHA